MPFYRRQPLWAVTGQARVSRQPQRSVELSMVDPMAVTFALPGSTVMQKNATIHLTDLL
jgi:hypothetical protein